MLVETDHRPHAASIQDVRTPSGRPPRRPHKDTPDARRYKTLYARHEMPTEPANADADLTSAETPVEGHAGEQYPPVHSRPRCTKGTRPTGADNSGHSQCDCGVS